MRGGGAARAAEQEMATLRAKVAVAEGVAEAGVAYLKRMLNPCIVNNPGTSYPLYYISSDEVKADNSTRS